MHWRLPSRPARKVPGQSPNISPRRFGEIPRIPPRKDVLYSAGDPTKVSRERASRIDGSAERTDVWLPESTRSETQH